MLFNRTRTATVPEVDAEEATRMAAAGARPLDVREDDEWVAGHAPGATHIAIGMLDTLDRTPLAQRPLIAVCRSGNRSRRAAATLAGRGFDVVSLAGGMKAWAAAGYAVVDDVGRPGTVM
jgi:rhodanese-related sulfurtransferase